MRCLTLWQHPFLSSHHWDVYVQYAIAQVDQLIWAPVHQYVIEQAMLVPVHGTRWTDICKLGTHGEQVSGVACTGGSFRGMLSTSSLTGTNFAS